MCNLPLRVLAYSRRTAFQVRVWQALLKIPSGTLVSYGSLAVALNQPAAARAVGSAVGRNSLAYLIPCHRVIRETGIIGNYRWGSVRKRALVAWEEKFDSRTLAFKNRSTNDKVPDVYEEAGSAHN